MSALVRRSRLAMVVAALAVAADASSGEANHLDSQASSESVKLRARIAVTPILPLARSELSLDPPLELGMVSSVAVDRQGLLYILHRGDQADPVIVTDASGKVQRSWGGGMFAIPHNIRVDPQGHIWTVDAQSSKVLEFDPSGKQLREIQIELPDEPRGSFHGATDIAFAPDGDFYVSDGYQNARVIRFSRDGARLGEWGSPGTGPGEFDLPHAIAVDSQGRVYVADRENLRIQRFDAEGRTIDQWNLNGKVFSLKWTEPGTLWAGTQPHDVPNGSEGWLMRLDPATGALLGTVEGFGHSLDVTPSGGLATGHLSGKTILFQPR